TSGTSRPEPPSSASSKRAGGCPPDGTSCGPGSGSRRDPTPRIRPEDGALPDDAAGDLPSTPWVRPSDCSDLYSEHRVTSRCGHVELDRHGASLRLARDDPPTDTKGTPMYSLILLNGGIGSRTGADSPKQLLKLRGIPILVYTLVTADRVEQISQIVLNYPPQWREDVESILKAYAISPPVTLVEAGSSRHSSVAAMIPHCTNDDVIIHETARPLVRTDDFQRLIDSEH